MKKICIDDGMNPELVRGAKFEGVFEIPVIHAPSSIVLPDGFTPFSKRKYAPSNNEALSFFEFDSKFADVLKSPQEYQTLVKQFSIFVPPDCSVYLDAPFAVQVANIYRSRAIGAYFQLHGANVWPLARWGDERSYTSSVFPEPLAFAGIEKGSPVVVSTYGCVQKGTERLHFKAGLAALIEYVQPQLVLVHGSMPRDLFEDCVGRTQFVRRPAWIDRMKGRN